LKGVVGKTLISTREKPYYFLQLCLTIYSNKKSFPLAGLEIVKNVTLKVSIVEGFEEILL